MLAALLAATMSGCELSGMSSSAVNGTSDTHSVDPSDNESSSESSSGGLDSSDISDDSGGSSTDSSDSVDPNSADSSPGDVSGSSGESPGNSSSGNSGESSGGNSSSDSNSSSSNSTTSSSTAVEPKPPVPVVIPDFEVPTSPGVNIFSAASGWVDYSNASKGYISAKYTGSKSRSKLRIEANGETYTYDLTVGGVVEYFPLSIGNGTYTVTLYELISGSDYSTVLKKQFEANITNPRSPFTYPNRYVDYSDKSECVYKAAELCAGKSDNISKIAAIFQWITDNVTYDYELAKTAPKTYYPDPDRTMQKRTGICYDYASLMAAMLRSQSIPTRLVIGYAGDTKHAWNEIYTEQTGWITPELLLKNNGYNTVDATFYAGADNKSKIVEYIQNPANYSAIYYY